MPVADIGDEQTAESVQTSGQDEAVEVEVAAMDAATDVALPGLAAKDEVISALRALVAETDPRARITSVAAIKATCSGTSILDEPVEIAGETLTIGLLADKVAAGAFTKEANTIDSSKLTLVIDLLKYACAAASTPYAPRPK